MSNAVTNVIYESPTNTEEWWVTRDPVIPPKLAIVVTQVGGVMNRTRIKVGDGVHRFTELEYVVGDYAEGELALVATTGSYADLLDKPASVTPEEIAAMWPTD